MTDHPEETTPTPVVTLGGRDWPVPLLPWRVRKRVTPLALRLGALDFGNITTPQMEQLGALCHAALTVATPALTSEQFDELPVSMAEMIAALPVILAQAGLAIERRALPSDKAPEHPTNLPVDPIAAGAPADEAAAALRARRFPRNVEG